VRRASSGIVLHRAPAGVRENGVVSRARERCGRTDVLYTAVKLVSVFFKRGGPKPCSLRLTMQRV
jgi:hypothetical protein